MKEHLKTQRILQSTAIQLLGQIMLRNMVFLYRLHQQVQYRVNLLQRVQVQMKLSRHGTRTTSSILIRLLLAHSQVLETIRQDLLKLKHNSKNLLAKVKYQFQVVVFTPKRLTQIRLNQVQAQTQAQVQAQIQAQKVLLTHQVGRSIRIRMVTQ